MSAPADFAALFLGCRDEIHAFLPEGAASQLSATIGAFAAIMTLARCRLVMRRHANTFATTIICRPEPGTNSEARAVIAMAEDAVFASFSTHDAYLEFPLREWIDTRGFLPFVGALVRAGMPHARIEKLALHIGKDLRVLAAQLNKLGARHRNAIVKRDLQNPADVDARRLHKVLYWALAPDFIAKPERTQVLFRRRQALDLYSAVSNLLCEPEISAAIDAGEPLNVRLAARLEIDETRLRRLRGLRSGDAALAGTDDYQNALTRLLVHEVPLHQWPKAGEWDQSIWNRYLPENRLRPDYLDNDTGRRDAFVALMMDLLSPLAGDRRARLALPRSYQVDSFVSNLHVPHELAKSEIHRSWLRAIRQAVIGPRGIKSFAESTQRWHRRAATIAALRHEGQTDMPGWPALCAPWQCADGLHSIVPLTGAGDLVTEGTALEHCVGGYYPLCRTGSTQILSLREGERRCATLELLIDATKEGLRIKSGQFKAHRNSTPARLHRAVAQAFLADLQAGRHPVFAREIRTYRRTMASRSDHSWRSEPLPISHAERAWPLYRTMLPKGLPETYQAWCEETGLVAAADAMIRAIAELASRPSSDILEVAP